MSDLIIIPSATDRTGVPQLEKKSIPLCVPERYDLGAFGSLDALLGKLNPSIGKMIWLVIFEKSGTLPPLSKR